MSYKQEIFAEVAQQIKKEGFRVFVADSGTYGFFTDTEGTRVISIGMDFTQVKASGNYKTNQPKLTGTGWGITDNVITGHASHYFNASAPRWAVGDSKWRFTTLNEHLATYQTSSKYKEV